MIMVLGPTKKKAEAKAEERRRRTAAEELAESAGVDEATTDVTAAAPVATEA